MNENVSLFIPIYNSENLIERALEKSYAALSQLNIDFEIILVDDNSTDKSDRFKHMIENANYPGRGRVRYIRYHTGPSRRENLAQSFYLAKYDTICFIDADFSCDILYAVTGIQRLYEEAGDIVIASRYIRGAKAKRRWIRRILSFFYNLTVRIVFKSKIYDHQCGLKIFRKSLLMPLLQQMGYDAEYTRGWFWDAELLIRAQRSKLKIIEMPVEWHYAKTSSFNLFRERKCIKSMIKLKREVG